MASAQCSSKRERSVGEDPRYTRTVISGTVSEARSILGPIRSDNMSRMAGLTFRLPGCVSSTLRVFGTLNPRTLQRSGDGAPPLVFEYVECAKSTGRGLCIGKSSLLYHVHCAVCTRCRLSTPRGSSSSSSPRPDAVYTVNTDNSEQRDDANHVRAGVPLNVERWTLLRLRNFALRGRQLAVAHRSRWGPPHRDGTPSRCVWVIPACMWVTARS